MRADRGLIIFLVAWPTMVSAADLTIVSFRCDHHEWGDARLIGEVRNDSAEPIRSVRFVANFRTAADELIESAEGYAKVRPLMPGQSSGFHVTGPSNPQYAKCEISAIFEGYSKRLSFSVAPEPKKSGNRTPEPRLFKCVDPAGTTIFQDRPCE